MLTIALLASVLAASGDPEPLETRHSPAWLPRYAAVQLFIRGSTVSLSPRIAWEVALIEQPRNDFVLIAEVGPGFSLATQSPTTQLWQHVALLGFGYRMTLRRVYWGLSVGFGPVLHGLKQPGYSEQRVSPYLEGRLLLGLNLGAVRAALQVGLGQATTVNVRVQSLELVGGPFLGVLVDWK